MKLKRTTMNRIANIYIVLLIVGCSSSKIIPPKIKRVSDTKFSTIDTIVFWRIDSLKKAEYYSIDEMYPLSSVKKKFKINKGSLFDIRQQEIVSNVILQLRTDTLMGKDVEIRDGLPYGHYCDFTNGVTCRMDIHYDETGNIDGYFSVNKYDTVFKKGTGYWKDYYSDEKSILKEEGEVKNNFKFGEWKYYNKEGKIDSIKTYSLKDSIDVRFPYCIFNKKEPCY